MGSWGRFWVLEHWKAFCGGVLVAGFELWSYTVPHLKVFRNSSGSQDQRLIKCLSVDKFHCKSYLGKGRKNYSTGWRRLPMALAGSERPGREAPPLLGSDSRWMSHKNSWGVGSRGWQWVRECQARWREPHTAFWWLPFESWLWHIVFTLRFVHV